MHVSNVSYIFILCGMLCFKQKVPVTYYCRDFVETSRGNICNQSKWPAYQVCSVLQELAKIPLNVRQHIPNFNFSTMKERFQNKYDQNMQQICINNTIYNAITTAWLKLHIPNTKRNAHTYICQNRCLYAYSVLECSFSNQKKYSALLKLLLVLDIEIGVKMNGKYMFKTIGNSSRNCPVTCNTMGFKILPTTFARWKNIQWNKTNVFRPVLVFYSYCFN